MENKVLNKIKKASFLFLLGLLVLPIVQDKLPFAGIRHLGGWVTWASKPYISKDGWFSGEYQKGLEAYINQQFGFRTDLVRLNNQLDYWFFKQANAKGIIYGDEGYLHDKLYTDAFYGLNYIGDKKIDSITDQMKMLQDRLAEDNKTFIMVFAAGKATYYEEYIPKRYRLKKKKTNYQGFRDAMKKKGINHIDFNDWFLRNKTRSKYPLFPQLGIHWSIYGSAVAFDSIEKYIEAKRKIDMPDFTITGVQQPDTLRTPDDDIFQALNIMGTLPYYKMAYPVIEIKNPGKYKPSIITVGDSFWWNIYNLGVNDAVFREGQFWYYNRDLYRGGSTEIRQKKDADFGTELEKTEVIVFCYTEGTVQDMGNGFLDELDKYYKSHNDTRKRDIRNFSEFIRGNKTWMEALTKKSKETHVPVDTLILRDATWQADNNPQFK